MKMIKLLWNNNGLMMQLYDRCHINLMKKIFLWGQKMASNKTPAEHIIVFNTPKVHQMPYALCFDK